MRLNLLLVVTRNALNLISQTTTVKQVRDGIFYASLAKCSQSQGAGVAVATRTFRLSITGPRQFKWRRQFQPFFDDLRFSHSDYGCSNFDICFRLCADINDTLKRFVKLRTTIRIAG